MQLNNKYDIVVVGAGIAGVSAAVKGAQMGKSVLICEHYAVLGGMSSAGLVSPFMKHEIEGRPLVAGVFEQIEKEMIRLDGMIDNGFYAWSFRAAAVNLLEKYGVHIAYNTDLIGAHMNGEVLESVDLSGPQGVVNIKAAQFIDCSGDAQLVAQAGLPWEKGDEETSKLQAMTLFFRMGGIDVEACGDYARAHQDEFLPWMEFDFDHDHIVSIAGFTSFIKQAIADGEMDDSIEYVFFTTLPSKGEGSFNCTNVLNFDASDSHQLSLAERKGHRQAHQIVDLLINKVPGFENAYLLETGLQIGVRETRRAVGDYQVTGSDILDGKKFDTVVARACYGIDIHGAEGEESRMEELEEGSWYEVPFEALRVKNAKNVMVAGRCISSTREGHSALRIMPTSSATGEACGAAAALAIEEQKELRELDYSLLKEAIKHNL